MKKRFALPILQFVFTIALYAQHPFIRPPAAEPLFIVDSLVIEKIDHLDPNSIESITVLKGQDAVNAAAAYGKSGAGGVVMIRTKDPKKNLSVQQFLSRRRIKVTPHTLVMIDNKLIRHPESLRVDTSMMGDVILEKLSSLTYLDSVYSNLELVRIYRKKTGNTRPAAPPDPYAGFENLKLIRSMSSQNKEFPL